jgi:uncharacterized protein (DUF2267 family)
MKAFSTSSSSYRAADSDGGLLAHRRQRGLRQLGWTIGVRMMERVAGHRRGDSLDFHLRASARDLLLEKGRAMRDEVEALAHSVMRSGSYARVEDASRAVDAVFDAMRERVPPELLLRLSEYMSEGEAARLRASIRQRLQREESFPLIARKER